MRKLSLRQTKSHFFFQDQIAINVVEPNWRAGSSVAKGIERSEFRVEKVLLQGHAGERRGSCPKDLNSLTVFWEDFL